MTAPRTRTALFSERRMLSGITSGALRVATTSRRRSNLRRPAILAAPRALPTSRARSARTRAHVSRARRAMGVPTLDARTARRSGKRASSLGAARSARDPPGRAATQGGPSARGPSSTIAIRTPGSIWGSTAPTSERARVLARGPASHSETRGARRRPRCPARATSRRAARQGFRSSSIVASSSGRPARAIRRPTGAGGTSPARAASAPAARIRAPGPCSRAVRGGRP
jgi:hypothetical protein